MNWSFIPNLITILRILLLVPLSFFLLNEAYTIALILFIVAGFSDGFLLNSFPG